MMRFRCHPSPFSSKNKKWEEIRIVIQIKDRRTLGPHPGVPIHQRAFSLTFLYWHWHVFGISRAVQCKNEDGGADASLSQIGATPHPKRQAELIAFRPSS
jgi:hypothetical protein